MTTANYPRYIVIHPDLEVAQVADRLNNYETIATCADVATAVRIAETLNHQETNQ